MADRNADDETDVESVEESNEDTEEETGEETDEETELGPSGARKQQDEVQYRRAQPSLKNGLDLLRDLRKLQQFHGSMDIDPEFQWGQAEVDWVLENWPEMRSLTGIYFRDQEAQARLTQLEFHNYMKDLQ